MELKNSKFVTLLFIISFQFFAINTAYAFKLNTHVWIAQQVIDDLANDPDGLIEIPINGTVQKFKVDPAIKSAILSNPKMYRMGNIGPDASPDVIIGQFSIHPGPTGNNENPYGYGTDEWAEALEDYITDTKNRSTVEDIYKYKKDICEKKNFNLDKVWSVINTNSGSSDSSYNPWLNENNKNNLLDALADSVIDDSTPQLGTQQAINPAELAYQKGFLGHMAADVFAHSYVNHYAGDIYWLTDDEQEVEKRHAAIESFIDQRLPVLSQGKPYDLVPSNSEIPAAFLAEAFIFNDKLKNQYKNYNLTKYAYVLSRYRAAVRSAATSCAWTGISRFAGQAVFYYMTDGAYVPNEKQITAINQLVGKANNANGQLLAKSQEIKDEIDKNVLALHKKNFGLILSASNEVSKTLDKIIALDQDAKQKAEAVGAYILNKQCNLEGDITEKVCSDWKTFFLLPSICLQYKLQVKTPGCLNYAAYNQAVALRQKADDALAAAIRDNDAFFREKLIQLRDSMTSVMNTTNLAIKATTDITVAMGSSVDPFQSILTEWDKNITLSTTEWVRAHAQVQINSMNLPQTEGQNDNCWQWGQGISECVFKGGKGLEPLTNWINIYAPGLIGVPSGITNFLASANQTISQTSPFLKPITPLDPITRQLQRQIEKKVSMELSGINLTEELIKLTGDKTLMQIYKDSHAIFFMKWDDQSINSQFATHATTKWLKNYPTFTNTLYTETGANPNNPSAPVDPKVFNALNNAIVLAKLSLLDASQLNLLASTLGIKTQTIYGSPLYQGSKDQLIAQQIAKAIQSCPSDSLSASSAAACRQSITASITNNASSFPTPWGANNILYGAIKSIDGSQQWKQISDDENLKRYDPTFVGPQLNTEKAAQKFYADTYGYDLDSLSSNVSKYGSMFYKGFRFWQEDPGSPKTGYYFNRIFKMPLYGNGSTSQGASSSSQSSVAQSCGVNSGKLFASNVPGQGMSSAVPAANSWCGSCGITVVSKSTGNDISCR